jgi:hypothetical protein
MAELNMKMVLDLVDKASPKLKESGSNFKKFGTLLKTVAASAAAVGFARMIKGQIDAADGLAKLSQKIGVSVENLSTMRHVAELSGIDLQRFADGIKDLSRKLLEVENPTSRAAILFKSLGIEVRNAEGDIKSSFDIFLEIADVFADMEDGAQKSAAAMELLGESGLQMIPLLNQGSAAIRKMQKEAEQLGLQISTKTAKAAEQFNDSLTRISGQFSGVAAAGAGELLPTLNAITDALTESQNSGGTVQAMWSGLNEIFKAATLAVRYLYTGLDQLGRTIGIVAAAVSLAASGEFTKAKNVMAEWGDEMIDASDDFFKFKDALYDPAVIKHNEELRKNVKTQKDLAGAMGESKKKADEFIKALRKESEILGLSIGDQKRYEVKVIAATIADEKQRASFVASTEAMIKKIEAHNKLTEAQEAQDLATEEALLKNQEEVKAYEDTIRSAREMVEQMEFENSLIKLNNEEREVAIKLRALEESGIKEGSAAYDHFADRIKAAVKTSVQANKEGADLVGRFWENAAKNMEDVMSGFFFDVMQGNVTDLGDSFKRMVDKMVSDLIASQLLTSVFGAGFGSAFGGFRASGGPVSAGVPYIVGERQAEVFVPETNGTILPSVGDAMGGNTTHININAVDAKSVRNLFENDKRFLSDLVNKTNRNLNKR